MPVQARGFRELHSEAGIFEAVALGVVRSLGRRVTAVGDARMSKQIRGVICRVGCSGLANLADRRGAVHSKLVVLVGDYRRPLLAVWVCANRRKSASMGGTLQFESWKVRGMDVGQSSISYFRKQ